MNLQEVNMNDDTNPDDYTICTTIHVSARVEITNSSMIKRRKKRMPFFGGINES